MDFLRSYKLLYRPYWPNLQLRHEWTRSISSPSNADTALTLSINLTDCSSAIFFLSRFIFPTEFLHWFLSIVWNVNFYYKDVDFVGERLTFLVADIVYFNLLNCCPEYPTWNTECWFKCEVETAFVSHVYLYVLSCFNSDSTAISSYHYLFIAYGHRIGITQVPCFINCL